MVEELACWEADRRLGDYGNRGGGCSPVERLLLR